MKSLTILLLFAVVSVNAASEIREFDLKTTERLGNELTRASQRPDHGANTEARKRAQQTASNALQGRLYDIHYDYVVIDDPDGSGFLVYALAKSDKPGDVVLAGHFRVTVSVDGRKAERIDALSRSLAVQHGNEGLPEGSELKGFTFGQIVGSIPSETFVYTSNITKMPMAIVTAENQQMWLIENGKITKANR